MERLFLHYANHVKRINHANFISNNVQSPNIVSKHPNEILLATTYSLQVHVVPATHDCSESELRTTSVYKQPKDFLYLRPPRVLIRGLRKIRLEIVNIATKTLLFCCSLRISELSILLHNFGWHCIRSI